MIHLTKQYDTDKSAKPRILTQFMIKKQKKIEVQVEQRLMKQKRAKQLKEISVSNLQDPINLAP